VPDRADFDPMPWQSMAVWMLTQMKRWGYVKGDVNYKQIAEKVFLITDAKKQMKALDQKVPEGAYPKFKVMGKEFDPAKADAYAKSFAISKRAEPWPPQVVGPFKAGLVSLLILLLVLAIWYVATPPRAAGGRTAAAGLTPEQIEYAKMMGKDPGGHCQEWRLPHADPDGRHGLGPPVQPLLRQRPQRQGHRHPAGAFAGPRGAGLRLACLVAIPLGFVIGMSPLLRRALDPFIQVLKPISPLAWMPLALYTIKDSSISGIFVIFICSVWPMLINTAFGVASVKREWLNVAARWR
jgi:hypothetical protein